MSSRLINIVVCGMNRAFTVDLDALPLSTGHDGPGGSLLALLALEGIDIEHTCGGVGACSTCHVHILKGQEFTNPAGDQEEDALEKAPDLRLGSRLACCVIPSGEGDLEISIPSWNRNAVKEHTP